MPRKTKDLTESEKKAKKVVTSTKSTTFKTKKTASKSTRTKKAETAKKPTTKRTTTSKKAGPKKATTSKKTSTKKTSSKKTTVSKTTTKKKSTVTKKATRTRKPNKPQVLEYYDLPFRYNQTVVKILAQTPSTLFVYWDISDDDRQKYIDEFGETFFNDTYPVLIIHNKTMNYSFEIEINDFANSWYFNVNDVKCDYEIELGRRTKQNQSTINLMNNYQYITSSNVIEAPNNHILFETIQNELLFKNVKTNEVSKKDISTFDFTKYSRNYQNVYDIYKKMYNEDVDEIMNPSSSFKVI